MILNSGMALTGGLFFDLSTPPATVEYLVVAGGGSGSNANNIGTGGGGAGGLVTNAGLSVTSGVTNVVTVGAGGAAASTSGGGNNGLESSFNTIKTYSGSFNGSTQYLTTNDPINWSTFGSYTLEFWIYLPSLTGNQTFFTTGTGTTGTTGFYVYGAGAQVGAVGLGIFGVNEITTTNNAITANQWYHIAYTYNGTTTTIYVNGVAKGSGTTAVYANNTGNLVIAGSNSAPSMTGYLSNIRLAKLVVYTGTFTPPTSPLTSTQSAGTNISAITGVQTNLLTLQNATIIDNSTNAYTLTNTGSVATSTSPSPFSISAVGGGTGGFYAPYTNATSGGSGGGAAWNGTNLTTFGSGLQPNSLSGGLGNNGGQGGSGNTGGGGGGAGAVGGNAPGAGGAGGVGAVSTIITTAQATTYSVGQVVSSSVYFAGGGGGGGVNGSGAGAGGNGGGGAAGGSSTSGTNGTANTGGGGGATSYPNGAASGQGGKGVVIIRYPNTYAVAVSTTGSPSFDGTTGGYNTYIFTSSGSITF